MYGNRVMEISVIDFGVPATLELTDLREIPPLLLKDFIIIPPQVSYLFVLGDGEISGQTGFTSFLTHVKVCKCVFSRLLNVA